MDNNTRVDGGTEMVGNRIDQVNKLYNRWDGNLYHNHSSRQEKTAHGLLARKVFSPDAHILDVGCGDGKITAYLASNRVPQGKVVGLDYSENMLDFAREHYSQDEYPNLTFMHGDAQKLDFSEKFDHIVSFNCLHWARDHEAVLRGMYKSLKKGGDILLCIGAANSLSQSLVNDLARDPRWKESIGEELGEWIYLQDDVTYRDLLKKHGFTITYCRVEKEIQPYINRDAFSKVFETTVPHVALLTQEQRAEFVEEAVDRFVQAGEKLPENARGKVTQLPDGSFSLVMVRLVVQAKKEG